MTAPNGTQKVLNTEHISVVNYGHNADNGDHWVDIQMPIVRQIVNIRFDSQEAMTDFIEKNFIFFNK